MSVIRILPEDVSNRIAAGEVVERPASLVKELVENSLDAGARHLSVQVERGGRALVRVIDDGCGMDPEDALLCLEAHATSKVRDTADIEAIRTMGFRGEALPSIAAVTRFTLRTRPHDAETGSEVLVHGGTVRGINPYGGAPGTSVTAQDLFYNMPARRKFLRGVETEEAYIHEIMLLLALANPEVGFELTFDRRVVLSAPPVADATTRAALLLGRDVVGQMVPVAHTLGDLSVCGLVSRPGLTRSTRREQRLFVNRRPVESGSVFAAIRDAYHTLVMKGRYAPTLLYLTIPPDQVDINVHPTKKEARFRDERVVGGLVATAIRYALQGQVVSNPNLFAAPATTPTATPADPPHPALPPTATPARASAGAFNPLITVELHRAAAPPYPGPRPADLPAESFDVLPDGPAPVPHDPLPPAATGDAPPPAAALRPAQAAAPPPAAPAADPHLFHIPGSGAAHSPTSTSAADRDLLPHLRLIGHLANSYLLAEGPLGLVLIDQHAVHERVIFEQLRQRAATQDGASQGLLIPVPVDFAPADAALLRRQLPALAKLGLAVEEFGGNSFLITALPPHFPQDNTPALVRDLVDDLRETAAPTRRLDEDTIATAACKAAVKAHDPLTDAEVRELLAALARTELPYTCPHGRPTMINLPYGELEKRFGRRH